MANQKNMKAESAKNDKVQKFERDYGKWFDMTASAMKKNAGYEWTQWDSLALGQMFENWQGYGDSLVRPVFEAAGTGVSNLGPAITGNLGLVAMAYAALPIQNFASVQPLDDASGRIYYRKSVAKTTRGNSFVDANGETIITGVQEGQELISPLGAMNKEMDEFASENQTLRVKLTPGQTAITATLGSTVLNGSSGLNVKPHTLNITFVDNNGLHLSAAMDDGKGNVVGVNVVGNQSTIDYDTGALNVSLTTGGVTNATYAIISYSNDFIAATAVPTFSWQITSKQIEANYWLLQSSYSNIAEAVMKKRFGTALPDLIQSDLVGQISNIVMVNAIRKLLESAIRNEAKGLTNPITWSMTPEVGVSKADQRLTFGDVLVQAVDTMYKHSGKGAISAIITGYKGRQVLTTAGMQNINSSVAGPYICGNFGGVPVYFAPNTALTDNDVLVIYRGQNWFEAPLVYAPFLPVSVYSGQNVGNMLVNAHAGYHAAAIESLVDGFVQRIKLID